MCEELLAPGLLVESWIEVCKMRWLFTVMCMYTAGVVCTLAVPKHDSMCTRYVSAHARGICMCVHVYMLMYAYKNCVNVFILTCMDSDTG